MTDTKQSSFDGIGNEAIPLKKDQGVPQQTQDQASDSEDIVVHPASGLTAGDVMDALSDSEIGISRLFARIYRNRFCLNTSLNRWFVYRDAVWRLDQRRESIAACQELYDLLVSVKNRYLTGLTEEGEKLISGELKKITNIRKMENILQQAASGQNGLGVVCEDFDKSLRYIGAPNGIIDLDTGELIPGDPALYITKQVGAAYDPSAPEPVLFKNFLNDVFRYPLEKDKEEDRIRKEKGLKRYTLGDEEFEALCAEQRDALIGYIQRLFGYALLGTCRDHVFVCFWGEGRNGKGSLLRTIISALGKYGGEIQPSILLSSNQTPGGPSPEIGDLQGMRLAVASETNQGQFFDTSAIKRLTGGDTLVFRGVHGKDYIRFRPSHTIILQTNFRPNAPAEDSAFWMRMQMVPFLRRFVEHPEANNRYHRAIDKDLEEKKLSDELPGILKWVVDGARMYREQGLNPPSCVCNAVEEYKLSRDFISDFIEECCETGDHFKVKTTAFVKAFNEWRKDQGHRSPMSAAVVAERLERKGFGKKKSSFMCFKGLKLGRNGEEYLKPPAERRMEDEFNDPAVEQAMMLTETDAFMLN